MKYSSVYVYMSGVQIYYVQQRCLETIDSTSTDSGSITVTGGVGIGKNLNVGGSFILESSADASNISTGALQILGGASITKKLYVGDDVNINGNLSAISGIFTATSESTSIDTGAVIIYGGIGIASNLNIGNNVTVANEITAQTGQFTSAVESTAIGTGAIIISGGASIASNTFIGGDLNVSGSLNYATSSITSTIDSTDTQTGALTVAGGVGIGRNANIGGNIVIYSSENSTSLTSGSLVVSGGAAINNNMYVGENVYISGRNIVTNYTNAGLQSIVYSSLGGFGVINNNTSPLSSYTAFSVGGKEAIVEDHFDIIYNHVDDNSAQNYVTTQFGTTPITKISREGIYVYPTTGSSNTMTGSVIVSGGVGISENLYVGGTGSFTNSVTILDTTQTISTSTGSLVIFGGVGIAKSLNVGGYATINSTLQVSLTTDTTELNSGSVIVSGGVSIDKNLIIGGNGIITSDLYTHGTSYALSTNDSTSTDTGSLIVSGGVGISGNLYVGGSTAFSEIIISSSVDATSTDTGSLIISGGVGIAKNIYIGGDTYASGNMYSSGIIEVTNTTDTTTTNIGSLKVAGGVGIAKNLAIGGNEYIMGDILVSNNGNINGTFTVYDTIYASSTNDSTSTDSGSLIVTGGMGVIGSIYGTIANFSEITVNQINIDNTTSSTSTDTGSLTVLGGIGVAENLYIGGTLNITNTINTTTSDVGSVVVYGGVGIAKNLVVGENEYIIGDVNVSGNEIINGDVTIFQNEFVYGTLYASSTDNSTSYSTGSLVVLGGIGINGSLYGDIANFNELNINKINITDSTSSTSTDTGSLVTLGGIGVAENIYIGGILNATNTTDTTLSNAGSVVVYGGVGIAKNLVVGGTEIIVGDLSILGGETVLGTLSAGGIISGLSTVNATSTDSGSLIVSGGVGIAESLYVGTNETINGTLTILSSVEATDTLTGALTIAGGVGIGGSLYTSSLTMTNTVTSIDIDDTLAANSDFNLPTQQAVKSYVDTLATLLKNPTGFPNTTDSVITYDDLSREIIISPVSTSFSYYVNYVKYTKTTSESIVISNVDGEHYIYYNGPTLSESTVLTYEILSQYVFVASAYWNTNDEKFIHVGDERHGMSMSPDTHMDLHFGVGTVYVSGLSIGNIVIGDGSSDIHAQFSVDPGLILDEDIRLSISSKLTNGSIKLIYLLGNLWTSSTTTGAFYSDNTKLYYNKNSLGNWTVEPVTDGNYVLGHVIATNDRTNHVVMGQGQYSTVDEAHRAAIEEIANIYASTLPLADGLFIGTIIYVSNSTFTNTYKCAIVEVSSGMSYIDWRNRKMNSISGVNGNHSTLSGLANDDHLQYVKVNGRSNDIIHVTNTNNATDNMSGAIYVDGGAGIQKDLFVGGNEFISGVLTVQSSNDSTSTSSGSLVVNGGVGIATNLYVGGLLDASSSSTGTLVVIGGAGIGGNLFIGSTTDTTSSDTGSLVVSGGAGIGSNLFIGGTTGTTSTDTGSLIVSGGAAIAENLYIGGNLNVEGMVEINQTLTTGNVDITGTAALFQVSEYVPGNGIEFTNGTVLYISDTTDSGSIFTGAVRIAGGVSINKQLYIDDSLIIGGTKNSTSLTSGSLQVTGGAAITEDLVLGGILTVHNTTNATATGTGCLIVSGGMSINKDVIIGGSLDISGSIEYETSNITSTIESTNTSSGALTVAGGVGIGRNVHVGGKLYIEDTTESTSSDTGCIIVSGGAGITGNLNVGGNCVVTGSLSKGSGSFDIPHPDPNKENWRLKHYFVESNTEGDNIYRYKINTSKCKATIMLPEYFKHLNKNPQFFITPIKSFGTGYGEFNETLDSVDVTTSMEGEYNVLIIGTRKDKIATDNYEGIEISPRD